jgi:hypothetical protein
MAHSPPVAPHPASRRRSYVRLQAGGGIPGDDLHLPDRLRSQAHGAAARMTRQTHSLFAAEVLLFCPLEPPFKRTPAIPCPRILVAGTVISVDPITAINAPSAR